MSIAKVLISDELSPAAVEIFRERGIEVDQKTGLKPEELKEIIGHYDGLAIRSATKLTKELISAAKKLKVVGRAGIGVDNIDIPAATAAGIIVMNTPFGNSITTAEHAVAMMMALARDLPTANTSTQGGKWEKSRFMGVELFGKTLGVIGCGNIGAIVADRAIGLKMKVIAYDPFLSAERAKELGVEKVELPELYRRSDFITLHTPMTDQTRGIINAAAIAQMKKGVRLINCARGGLIVEADLKAALDSGHVAGAALDVFEKEPAKENPLFGSEKIICTPHLGASTNEAQENVALQVAEQISDLLIKGAVVNALNMPSVSAEDAPKLKPYMRLAAQLGTLAGQLAAQSDGSIVAVTLDYEGQAAALNTRPLSAVALASFLQPQINSVNMVNAPVIARERGIAVSDTRHDKAHNYQTLLRLTVKRADGSSFSVAGTLFAGEKPRLVELDGVAVEAELTGSMLYTRNDDKPGFIGKLGSMLGDAKVNIATFHLGRTAPNQTAVALVAVDSEISPELLGKIRAEKGVLSATSLVFPS